MQFVFPQVKERRFSGFNPNVIFQGKVRHRASALLPADGETPRFVQLYVFDPSLESTQRYENMVLPRSATMSQKIKLKDILNVIQEVMHLHNPFINDFKQIMEMNDSDLAGGK